MEKHNDEQEKDNNPDEDKPGPSSENTETETEGEDSGMEKIRKYLIQKLKLYDSDTEQESCSGVLKELTIDGIIDYIKQNPKCKIITMAGAGISTSAGIPDFRSPSSGLYHNLEKYNLPHPQAVFELDFFMENPEPFFTLAKQLLPEGFKPTPCHYFIRLLWEKGLLLRHYTQNIDTLERIAGLPAEKLIEAHGTFHTGHCLKCRAPYTLEWMKEKILESVIPKCEECEEGVVKPDVVFFGEMLPERFHYFADRDFVHADLLIIMGSSLVVQPFASLIDRVRPSCPRLLINKEKAAVKIRNIKGIQSANSSSLVTFIEPELEAIKAAGTWKSERIIVSPQRTRIILKNGIKALNFCANNYLGLADNKEIIASAKVALDKYGAGLSSVRFICGTQEIHCELEKKIAAFHGREAAILYASCFDANAGLFEALLIPEDAVFSDELNHASIIDGIRLCKAKKYRYKHRDMADLERQLKENSTSRLRVIATDGVFSMDGTIAPLSDIIELAKKYDAITFVDDCHATGFFGKTGRGTEEYFNHVGSIDIINSTLGKALGGAAGGYTVGKKELIDLLKQRSRPYLFSNSLPPPVVATANKVMDLITSNTTFLDNLVRNTEHFRKSMIAAGFTINGNNHPICPVMLGDAKLASTFADEMIGKEIYVIGFSYPVVPKGKARIRVQISAAHTKEDIDKAVNAFIYIGKKLSVI